MSIIFCQTWDVGLQINIFFVANVKIIHLRRNIIIVPTYTQVSCVGAHKLLDLFERNWSHCQNQEMPTAIAAIVQFSQT